MQLFYNRIMQKIIPLTVTFFALALTACGGGGSGGTTPKTVNVTGNWGGSLQTSGGAGLGSVDVALTQSAAPATDFKGTLTASMFGGNHPVIGDAAKGTIKSDLSSGTVNEAAAFACSGTFTNTSYRGNCEMVKGGGTFVLVLGTVVRKV